MVVPAAHAAKISVGKCFKLGKLKLGDIPPGEWERERERDRGGLCSVKYSLISR